jgi:hypothetical protein
MAPRTRAGPLAGSPAAAPSRMAEQRTVAVTRSALRTFGALTFEQKVEVLEELEIEVRLEKLVRWARETLAEVSLKDRIKSADLPSPAGQAQSWYLLQDLPLLW